MKVVLYMPVIHQGYFSFLKQYAASDIFVLANNLAEQFKPLKKDIRALNTERIVDVLKVWKIGKTVTVASEEVLRQLNDPTERITMPNEEPMQALAAQYFPNAQLVFADVFLRWDSAKTLSHQELDQHHNRSTDPQDSVYLFLARQQAAQSVDQWRQVGAVLVKNGKVVFQHHNHHLPDDYQPVYNGDPRGNFSKGEYIDLGTAQHAEAAIVAQAAKEGVSLAGADLYVTTFPCPVCAKLVAETGVKRVLFGDGYSMVDGVKVLEAAGIELVKVQ